MAELFFVATTIFVAYVVFAVMDDHKPKTQDEKPDEAATPKTVETTETKLEPAAEKPATPARSSRSKPVSAAAVKTADTDSLKNPKTGEVAKIPRSYSFAKRWIKEALVEEGLLEKIYKNNELDEAASTKIHSALEQLKAMEKYQP